MVACFLSRVHTEKRSECVLRSGEVHATFQDLISTRLPASSVIWVPASYPQALLPCLLQDLFCHLYVPAWLFSLYYSVYLNKCIFCILHFCPQCLFSFLHVLLRVRMAKSQVLKNIMLFSPQPCCVLSFLIKKPEIKMNKCVFSFLYGLLSWRCVL